MTKEQFESAISWLREAAPGTAERLTPIYKSLGWKWGLGEDEHVPNFDDLYREIHQMIDQLCADVERISLDDVDHIETGESGGLNVCVDYRGTIRHKCAINFMLKIGCIDPRIDAWRQVGLNRAAGIPEDLTKWPAGTRGENDETK